MYSLNFFGEGEEEDVLFQGLDQSVSKNDLLQEFYPSVDENPLLQGLDQPIDEKPDLAKNSDEPKELDTTQDEIYGVNPIDSYQLILSNLFSETQFLNEDLFAEKINQEINNTQTIIMRGSPTSESASVERITNAVPVVEELTSKKRPASVLETNTSNVSVTITQKLSELIPEALREQLYDECVLLVKAVVSKRSTGVALLGVKQQFILTQLKKYEEVNLETLEQMYNKACRDLKPHEKNIHLTSAKRETRTIASQIEKVGSLLNQVKSHLVSNLNSDISSNFTSPDTIVTDNYRKKLRRH